MQESTSKIFFVNVNDYFRLNGVKAFSLCCLLSGARSSEPQNPHFRGERNPRFMMFIIINLTSTFRSLRIENIFAIDNKQE